MIAEAPHFDVLEVVSLPERRDREIAQRVKTGQTAFRLAQIFHPDVVATDERFLAAEKHALIALLPKKYAIPVPLSEDEITTTPPPDIDDLYEHVTQGMQTITDVVSDNLGLVSTIARKASKKYLRDGMSYDDYFDVGVEGAMKGIVRYDASKGKLSMYLGAKIDFAMRDAFRAMMHTRYTISDNDVFIVSLEQESKNPDKRSLEETLSSDDPEDYPEEVVIYQNPLNTAYKEVLAVVEELDERRRDIFKARYNEEQTLKVIAENLEEPVSKGRVSQLLGDIHASIRAGVANPFADEQTA